MMTDEELDELLNEYPEDGLFDEDAFETAMALDEINELLEEETP